MPRAVALLFIAFLALSGAGNVAAQYQTDVNILDLNQIQSGTDNTQNLDIGNSSEGGSSKVTIDKVTQTQSGQDNKQTLNVGNAKGGSTNVTLGTVKQTQSGSGGTQKMNIGNSGEVDGNEAGNSGNTGQGSSNFVPGLPNFELAERRAAAVEEYMYYAGCEALGLSRDFCNLLKDFSEFYDKHKYTLDTFEMVILGDFSENFTEAGLVINVIIGFIPIAGQIADVRDLVANVINVFDPDLSAEEKFWGVALSAFGFIPGLGDLKHLKHADEVSAAVRRGDNAGNARRGTAGRNDPHGDGGRAQTKAEKQVEELKEQLKTQTGKEAKQTKQKIKNIEKSAAKDKKGETHWKKGK
jgi:hypothetical protein